MIQEEFIIKEEYYRLSNSILESLQSEKLLNGEKLVIGICGQSGSGKSITAKCLHSVLSKNNITSVILHQDSYYKLPPTTNHNKRKQDISWVGPNEVNLELIQNHIEAFKTGQESIRCPSVNYRENTFSFKDVNLKETTVLIIEGVYALLLEELDFKIFLERTYLDSRDDRRSRTREKYDPFVEEVLHIEHDIISSLQEKADLLISKDYKIRSIVAK